MAMDPTPWMIAGGAMHSADLGRTLAFASTSGAEGIVLPESMKVTALGTPGAAVNVAHGAALLLNRSPGGAEQTYVARNASDTQVSIAPTGGSARSDLVVVRIEDPQFPPWQMPADPATATYTRIHVIQNVAPTTTRASELNLGYPALALARIDVPANTSAIAGGHIKDMRRVAQPRRERRMLTAYPTSKFSLGPEGAGAGWHNWPDNYWRITVPSWATRAVVSGTIAGAKVGHPDTSVNGDIDTQVRVVMGTSASDAVTTQASQQEWLTVVSPNTGQRGYMRGDIATGGELDVTAFRDTTIDVRFQGAILAGRGEIFVDAYSTLLVDVEFVETPV